MIETVNMTQGRYDALMKFWDDNHPLEGAVPSREKITAGRCERGRWYYYLFEGGGWFQFMGHFAGCGYGFYAPTHERKLVILTSQSIVHPIASDAELEEKPRLDDDGNEIPHWGKHMYDVLFEKDDKEYTVGDLDVDESLKLHNHTWKITSYADPEHHENETLLVDFQSTTSWANDSTPCIRLPEESKIKEHQPHLSCPSCGKGILDWHTDNPKHPYAICRHCKIKLVLVPEEPDGECIIEDLKVGERFIERGKEWVKRENVTKLHSGEVLCVALDVKANIDFVVDPKWPCTRL